MRCLMVWDCGPEEPLLSYRRDLAQLAAVGALRGRGEDVALTRLWHRDRPTLSFGRFHRFDASGSQLCRRLTGGKVVASRPGVLCLTTAVPRAPWLDPTQTALRPEQILNRALRPLLALLRAEGVDAFYPGKDLVTVDRRPLAHASFTVMEDGATLVEVALAAHDSLSPASLLAELDPQGVCATDPSAFASAVTLAELRGGGEPPSWARRYAELARGVFDCEVEISETTPSVLATLEPAHATSFAAFNEERQPVPESWSSAVGFGSLGVIEAAASIEDGRIARVLISGDIIAPFRCIDEIERRLEGGPPAAAAARRAATAAATQAGAFVFGLERLDDLIGRLGQ